jgi:tRNA (guanine-N7-)-methyltransferase
MNLLKDGGTLTFKTDNVGLFDFTLLEIEAMGLTVKKLTRDLHNSEYNSDNVMTEYEENFSSMGMPINMVEVEKPENYTAIIPENLSKNRKDYGRDSL